MAKSAFELWADEHFLVEGHVAYALAKAAWNQSEIHTRLANNLPVPNHLLKRFKMSYRLGRELRYQYVYAVTPLAARWQVPSGATDITAVEE